MTVRVRFFAYFRDLFGIPNVDVPIADAATMGALLDRLCDTPAKKAELFDGISLRPHRIIMLNGAPLPAADPLAATLKDGDVVAIFPLLSGG